MVRKLTVLGILLALLSCSDANIYLSKSAGENDYIDITGYYLSLHEGKLASHFEGFVLYGNGCTKQFYGSAHKDFFSEDFFYARVNARRDEKIGWGVWKIEGNKIIIHYWGASSGGGLPKVTRRGKIESKTQFCLEEMTGNGCEDYVLYPSNSKPDSTNQFLSSVE